MERIVDFHTHILPCIDDGSRSIEQTAQMIEMEKSCGVKTVVATPHFYPDRDNPDSFLQRRWQAYDSIDQLCGEDFKILLGAEVYYSAGISEWDRLGDLTIEGTRCIMIEMPMPPWTKSMYAELEKIYTRRGYVPVIAHMDRYIRPFRTYKIPEKLQQMNVMVQCNSSFFIDRSTSWFAKMLLKAGKIQLVGSDCHNTAGRKPNIDLALGKIGDDIDCIISSQEQIFEAVHSKL